MSRRLITFSALSVLFAFGSTQMGGCGGGGGGGDPYLPTYTLDDKTLDLMMFNQDFNYYWVELGWSGEGSEKTITERVAIGWLAPNVVTSYPYYLNYPGSYYLLLYNSQGGQLLDISDPFQRLENDVLFVDAIVSGGTFSIDAY